MISHGGIEVDVGNRVVFVHGGRREVPGRRFDLLVLLIRNPGGVTLETLRTAGWECGRDTLRQNIKRLRDDLGRDRDSILDAAGTYRLVDGG